MSVVVTTNAVRSKLDGQDHKYCSYWRVRGGEEGTHLN